MKRHLKTIALLSLCLFLQQCMILPSGYMVSQDGRAKVWNNYRGDPDDRATWDGDVVDGYAQGDGTLTWWKHDEWTSKYTGSMVEGKLHGHVYNTDSDGEHYEGDFAHGRKSANWSKVTWDGDVVDGYARGHGTLTWWRRGAWTSKYTGSMVKGKLHGHVYNIDSDGERFEGNFVHGQKSANWSKVSSVK